MGRDARPVGSIAGPVVLNRPVGDWSRTGRFQRRATAPATRATATFHPPFPLASRAAFAATRTVRI